MGSDPQDSKDGEIERSCVGDYMPVPVCGMLEDSRGQSGDVGVRYRTKSKGDRT